MDTIFCSMCNIQKHINNFYKNYLQCKDCNRARRLERYYGKKDGISNQQKLYYEENREKVWVQKKNNRCLQIRDLVRSYAELENNLKALEEKVKKMTQKNIKIFINES